MTGELSERRRLILKEIVDRYIRRREPVSSRMILEDYGLRVSSATVRNEMNALEAAGYIEKPYSSSGRIPTKKGYRFFVDWLLDLSELTRKERREVVEAYQVRCLEVGETMRQTAFLLGNITGYAGFVIPPQWAQMRLDRVVLVPMEPRLVLLVVVSEIGVVEHGLIPLEFDLTEEEVSRAMGVINDTLRGMTLDDVRAAAGSEAPEGWYDRSVRVALLVMRRLLERRVRERLYLEGLLNMVDDLREVVPEQALDRLVGLIHAVQDEERFIEAVRRSRGGREGLVVNVGDFELPGLEEFSVVTCDYRPYSGVLGVIAPLWMDYSRALSATSYIANRLEALLVASCKRRLGGEEDDGEKRVEG